jgi:hypothetical protein
MTGEQMSAKAAGWSTGVEGGKGGEGRGGEGEPDKLEIVLRWGRRALHELRNLRSQRTFATSLQRINSLLSCAVSQSPSASVDTVTLPQPPAAAGRRVSAESGAG